MLYHRCLSFCKEISTQGQPLLKAGSGMCVCVCCRLEIPPFVSSALGSPFECPSKISPTSCLHLHWLWMPPQKVNTYTSLGEVSGQGELNFCVRSMQIGLGKAEWPRSLPSSDKNFTLSWGEGKLARPVGVETFPQLLCLAPLSYKLTHRPFLAFPLLSPCSA